MDLNLILRNKRWIILDLHVRVSTLNFFNLFQTFSKEQVLKLVDLFSFTVYFWFWAFDDDLNWKTRRFFEYTCWKLEIRAKRKRRKMLKLLLRLCGILRSKLRKYIEVYLSSHSSSLWFHWFFLRFPFFSPLRLCDHTGSSFGWFSVGIAEAFVRWWRFCLNLWELRPTKL